MIKTYTMDLTEEQYEVFKDIVQIGYDQYVEDNMDALNGEMGMLSKNAEDPSSYAALLQNYGDLHDSAAAVLEIVNCLEE